MPFRLAENGVRWTRAIQTANDTRPATPERGSSVKFAETGNSGNSKDDHLYYSEAESTPVGPDRPAVPQRGPLCAPRRTAGAVCTLNHPPEQSQRVPW
eukprot:5177731-Prymnesium_polylepis.1